MALGALLTTLKTFDQTLDQMIADRLPHNENAATYHLPDVRLTEVRGPQSGGLYPSPHPSLWVNGRYVGELACPQPPRNQSSLTLQGRFQHLAFVIENVA